MAKAIFYVFGFLIHCETVAQGRRIHNGKPTFVSVCKTADVFGKADAIAKGHIFARPSPLRVLQSGQSRRLTLCMPVGWPLAPCY